MMIRLCYHTNVGASLMLFTYPPESGVRTPILIASTHRVSDFGVWKLRERLGESPRSVFARWCNQYGPPFFAVAGCCSDPPTVSAPSLQASIILPAKRDCIVANNYDSVKSTYLSKLIFHIISI